MDFPKLAQKWMCFMIDEGALIPSRVDLEMHGGIMIDLKKPKKKFTPFTASQTIIPFKSSAFHLNIHGTMPLQGGDAYHEDFGICLYDLFGFIPLVTETGDDVTKSCRTRIGVECLTWLPGSLLLLKEKCKWEDVNENTIAVTFKVHHVDIKINIEVNTENGEMKKLYMQRWATPLKKKVSFGADNIKFEKIDGYNVISAFKGGYNYGKKNYIQTYDFIIDKFKFY